MENKIIKAIFAILKQKLKSKFKYSFLISYIIVTLYPIIDRMFRLIQSEYLVTKLGYKIKN